jgi:phosphoglycolate phosphatase-like HAD superfamily hydrolase
LGTAAPKNQDCFARKLVFFRQTHFTPAVPIAEDQLQIELLPSFQPRPRATHVVFDFDGTLSWIRHGWPEVMQTVMTDRIPLRDGETPKELRDWLFGTMYNYNGRPTAVYMDAMRDEIQERGGEADHSEMLEAFLVALDALAQQRINKISNGACAPDDYLVFGARKLVNLMTTRGLKSIILSGNPNDQVNREAELLGIADYCEGHIYGHVDANSFSKQSVMEKLMAEEKFTGENLIAIGDGGAEIKAARALGGLAVAICSDENVNGSGTVDPHKRDTLLAAGADAVIADYREPEALLGILMGE